MTKTIYITYEYYLGIDVAPRYFQAFSSRKEAEKHFDKQDDFFGNSIGRLGGLVALKLREDTKKKAQKKTKRPRGETGRRNGLKIRRP